MLQKFLHFINRNELFYSTDKILLTVSGGIDSRVMLDLFDRAGYRTGIAHCNFGLRGEESDNDEFFVEKLAEEYDIPFYTTRFDTAEYAKLYGISMQMAARDLRYDWFERIRLEHTYDYIALAHNRNDNIETFFINLTRGTGIKGLTGINPKSGRIIRPLLLFSRDQIKNYASEYHLEYREDSSNISTKYTRNKIRHEIIPTLTQINGSFEETMQENMIRLHETEEIFSQYISILKRKILKKDGAKTLLNIHELKKLHPIHTYLYEFLHPFGFSRHQAENIEQSFDQISGKKFYADHYLLIKDRDNLVITPFNPDNKIHKYYIEASQTFIQEPVCMEVQQFLRPEKFSIPSHRNVACLDFEKISFPLILRKWQRGDYFQPLGMGQMKKLSDYFIDRKYSLIDKKNAWLLMSGKDILWIINDRIDDRYKITNSTKQILQITFRDCL